VSDAQAPAEIFDLGYQAYDGPRTGRGARRAAIWRDGIRVALGLGRGAGAKFAPWLLIALALVPMVVLVIVSAVMTTAEEIAEDFELPSYADYYEYAIVPIALFAAVVAPQLVCPDRRDGVLSLYAARPITTTDYLVSRRLAFFTVAGAAVWLPNAVLFTWNALDASSTTSFLADEWPVVPRLIAAGALVAAVLTTLALLAASFTTRRAYAAVGTLAVLFIGTAVGGIAEDSFSGRAADLVSLVALPDVVIDAERWIFADEVSGRPFDGAVSAGWLALVTVVMAGVLFRRTRSLVRA
jgi:ABC-2 type transport system permease protein